MLEGLTDMVKSPTGPGAFTVRLFFWEGEEEMELEGVTGVEACALPVYPLVTMVRVELVEPLAGGVTVGPGLKPVPAANPLGRLSASSSTPLLNPLWLNTVTV